MFQSDSGGGRTRDILEQFFIICNRQKARQSSSSKAEMLLSFQRPFKMGVEGSQHSNHFNAHKNSCVRVLWPRGGASARLRNCGAAVGPLCYIRTVLFTTLHCTDLHGTSRGIRASQSPAADCFMLRSLVFQADTKEFVD